VVITSLRNTQKHAVSVARPLEPGELALDRDTQLQERPSPLPRQQYERDGGLAHCSIKSSAPCLIWLNPAKTNAVMDDITALLAMALQETKNRTQRMIRR
jgi:hypothetical protein